MGATERHLHCTGKLEQRGDGEADRAPTDARRNEGWGAVRPLDRQSHVLSGRMLHVDVAPTVLAANEPDDRQLHSLERVSRQRDGHALNQGWRTRGSVSMPS
jgi:hypothetical protein